MPSAIVLIVEGYVRLQDREALERVRMHRRQMLVDMKALSGLDVSRTITELEREIEIIEAGLQEMDEGSAPGPSE